MKIKKNLILEININRKRIYYFFLLFLKLGNIHYYYLPFYKKKKKYTIGKITWILGYLQIFFKNLFLFLLLFLKLFLLKIKEK